LKYRIDELETVRKNTNIRYIYREYIHEFRKGYQPLCKRCDWPYVFTYPQYLNRYKNYFSRLLDVHVADDGRQTEIHSIAEQLVPEPSSFEADIALDKCKGYKSHIVDQVPAELIEKGGKTLRSEIHKLICIRVE
jgi:hypothetical protein